MRVTCFVDSVTVKIASSVNHINGSNWRLVCNQWQNSRRMALSRGCRFCTRCGWNGYKPSSCNVRHTHVCKTPRSVESFGVLIVELRCTISRVFSCSSTCCWRANSDETWAQRSMQAMYWTLWKTPYEPEFCTRETVDGILQQQQWHYHRRSRKRTA